MTASLIEEAEAIGWYEHRMSLEKAKDAKAIMANAQKEESKHFGMNLEFLLRRKKKCRAELPSILFKEGDIVELGEKAEKKARLIVWRPSWRRKGRRRGRGCLRLVGSPSVGEPSTAPSGI